MATSGNFLTSDSGQGGGNFYGRTRFYWWRTDWGRSGSVGYHNVSYNLKTYGGSSSYWQYFYNGSMNVDGTGYTFSSPIKAYGNGATNLSGTKSKTMYTNSSGDRSFSASAQGGIYTSAINTTGSGSWSLNNIPMYGGITSVSPTSGLTDETSSISVNWYKYTGRATLWFRMDDVSGGTSDTTYRIRNVGPDPYSWSGFQTWLQNEMVSHNSSKLHIYYGDDLDSNGSEDHYNSALEYTITIANGSGQANPTFTDFGYEDTNATTVGITGDDQVLIQGKSTLEVTVDSSDAATTNKNANRGTYSFTIGSYADSETWPSSGDVVNTVGVVSDVSGSQNLSVKAVDSRTNNTTVTKSVSVLPYSSPTFVPDFDIKYTNDFDKDSGLTVVADGTKIADTSPLTHSSTDLNDVATADGVRFDMSKDNNTSYTGTWEDVTTAFGSGTGDITTTIATLEADLLTKMNGIGADNTVKWYIKFEITDELETTVYEVVIDIGKPIFRIGTDGYVYNNEERIPTTNQIEVLEVTFNNGTSTRSTNVASAGLVPGAIGDTSYTAPEDVSIAFTTSSMTDRTAGITRNYLAIDGAAVGQGGYTSGTAWEVHTTVHKLDVDKGETITIGMWWTQSSGTATITNNVTDSAFPNKVMGVVTPRNT